MRSHRARGRARLRIQDRRDGRRNMSSETINRTRRTLPRHDADPARAPTILRARSTALRWLNHRLNRGSLRILTYHGVCRDADRHAPWVPSHYVTQSALDRQLGLVRTSATLVDLRDVADLIRTGRGWRAPLVAITFDDAPANLLNLAMPVLAAHRVTATAFAVTDFLDTGQILPADARQAVGGRAARRRIDAAVGPLPQPIRDGLRHMRWREAATFVAAGHALGAHTATHPILSTCDLATRRDEIARSVQAVAARLGGRCPAFAYPSGQPNDFGAADIATLTELNVPLACSGVAGPNAAPLYRFALRRNCIGLYHTRAAFVAELLGLRDARQHKAGRAVRRTTPIAPRPAHEPTGAAACP
jgi:peptidoglycan/xylan/chitin deacetylase (PgdA/CDA1 family)